MESRPIIATRASVRLQRHTWVSHRPSTCPERIHSGDTRLLTGPSTPGRVPAECQPLNTAETDLQMTPGWRGLCSSEDAGPSVGPAINPLPNLGPRYIAVERIAVVDLVAL